MHPEEILVGVHTEARVGEEEVTTIKQRSRQVGTWESLSAVMLELKEEERQRGIEEDIRILRHVKARVNPHSEAANYL